MTKAEAAAGGKRSRLHRRMRPPPPPSSSSPPPPPPAEVAADDAAALKGSSAIRPPDAISSSSSSSIHYWWAGVGIFVLVLCVYVRTMQRHIPAGDSGELAASACHPSMVVHPPGYPLFTIVYWLWHQLWRNLLPHHHLLLSPLSPAAISNLLSALVSSCAAVLLFDAIHNATLDTPIAFVSALAYAFAPTVWLYAAQAEVFALNNFFTCLLIRLGLFAIDEPWPRRRLSIECTTALCAFVSGVAMCNQHTIALLILPLALSVNAVHRTVLCTARGMSMQAAAFAVGLLPYVWLPIASSYRTSGSWGDQTSLAGFLTHVSRAEYGSLKLATPDNEDLTVSLMDRIGMYGRHLLVETHIVLALVGLVGCAVAVRRRWRRRISSRVLSLAYLFYLTVFCYLNQMQSTPRLAGVQARFYMQPNAIVFYFVGVGWSIVAAAVVAIRGGRTIVLVMAAVSVLTQLVLNGGSRSFQNTSVMETAGHSLLSAMPRDALVLVDGDANYFSALYLQKCEQIRPDVQVLPLPLLAAEWFTQHLASTAFPHVVVPPPSPTDGYIHVVDVVNANIDAYPIVVCGHHWPTPPEHIDLFTFGMCELVIPATQSTITMMAPLYRKSFNALPILPPLDHSLFGETSMEFEVYATVYFKTLALFDRLIVDGVHLNDLPLAVSVVDRIVELYESESGSSISTSNSSGSSRSVAASAHSWLNVAVVYGLASRRDDDDSSSATTDKNASKQFEQRMFTAYRRFMSMADPSSDRYRLVSQILSTRVNPFTRRRQ